MLAAGFTQRGHLTTAYFTFQAPVTVYSITLYARNYSFEFSDLTFTAGSPACPS